MSSDFSFNGEYRIGALGAGNDKGAQIKEDNQQAGRIEPDGVLIDQIEQKGKDVEHARSPLIYLVRWHSTLWMSAPMRGAAS